MWIDTYLRDSTQSFSLLAHLVNDASMLRCGSLMTAPYRYAMGLYRFKGRQDDVEIE